MLGWEVVICVLIASVGGLSFGYNIGIAGGVVDMDDFQKKFYPIVFVKRSRTPVNNYCQYDNKSLQFFSSSIYIGAFVASIFGEFLYRRKGCRFTLRAASLFIFVGVISTVSAQHTWMLIMGRLLLGMGYGCGNKAIPLFFSHIAPKKYEDTLNIIFLVFIAIGNLTSSITNIYTSPIQEYGWRVSLGLAGIPAFLLCIIFLFVYDTPSSLIECGKLESGMTTLKKIRGTERVESEFQQLIEMAKVDHPFTNLMKSRNRPHLIIGIVLQLSQQFTASSAIFLYCPVFLEILGFSSHVSLFTTVITSLINVFGSLFSITTANKFGRRLMLLIAYIMILICQASIGVILALNMDLTNTVNHNTAVWVLIFTCGCMVGFSLCSGPLGFYTPGETFPFSMLSTFMTAQTFLSTLCIMRAYIFFFFDAYLVVVVILAVYFIPETKQINEVSDRVWEQHWHWKTYVDDR